MTLQILQRGARLLSGAGIGALRLLPLFDDAIVVDLRNRPGTSLAIERDIQVMLGDWLSQRVTLLEQQVEWLEGLPGEVSALRQDMNTQFVTLRAEMDARFDAVEQVLISLQTQITDNHRRALMLHEDVMSSIATLGEGYRPRSGPRKKR